MSEHLPAGWTWATLDDVIVSMRNGISTKPVGNDGIPILRISAVRPNALDLTDIRYLEAEPDGSVDYTLRTGDLLFTRYNGTRSLVGVCAHVPEGVGRVVYPDKLIRVRVNEALACPRYVQFASNSGVSRAFIESRARTTAGQTGVSGSDLRAMPLPLPPLPEQRRIVAALEEHLSALDAAVVGLERARANVQRFIASVLSAAAAGELIDGIAFGEWDAVTLQDVVDPTRKCAYGVLQPGPNVDDGVPLVRVGDVNDGVVSARDLKRISPAIASAYPRTRLRGGELLMTLVGTIGRTAVVPPDLAGANVARAIGVIPVGPRARAEWLNIWFRSPAMLSFMNAQAHEVARKTLNLEDVRAARVLLPPIDVQDQLVYAVEMRTDSARRLIGELDTQLARAKGVRRSILQSAFSGGLVPQDPADAPASIAPERDLTERSSAPASSRPARGRGRTARTGSRRG